MSTITYSFEQVGNPETISNPGGLQYIDPSLTALAGGGWLASYRGGAGFGSIGSGHLMEDDGAARSPSDFDIGQSSKTTGVSAAGLTDGRVVTLFSAADPTGTILAQLRDSNGHVLGKDIVVHADFKSLSNADVVGLKDGGFVVTWERHFSDTDTDVNATVFNSNGTERKFIPVTATNADETDPHVAALAGGGFVETWTRKTSGGTEVWFERFNANGIAQGGPKLANTIGTDNDGADVTGLHDGGFAIAFRTNGEKFGIAHDVALNVYDATGTLQNHVLASGYLKGGDQDTAAITTLSNGQIAVGWTDHKAGGDMTDVAVFGPQGDVLLSGLPGGFAGASDELALAGLGHGRLVGAYVDEPGPTTRHIADKIVDLVRTTMGNGASETLSGDDIHDRIFGGDGNDHLYGLGGNDLLNGGDGEDTVDGGDGADSMTGGGGNDIYVVDNLGDRIGEERSEGNDGVLSSVSFTLGANFENLALLGSADIDGAGNALDNRIIGNAGANRLDGGAGVDKMSGGAGDDTYIVDNVGDIVSEAGGAGTDLIRSSISLALAANVENLTLTGTAAINATGNALANVIAGNAGANLIDGGAGADHMAGGAGDDAYVVDNVGDVVTEAGGGGIDRITSSVNFKLGDNVENLTLVGFAGSTAKGHGGASGIGNGLANTIVGNAAGNRLAGDAGKDTLRGKAGGDRLDGGLGNDHLDGGKGHDKFVFDSALTHNVDKIGHFSAADDAFVLDNAIFTELKHGHLGAHAFTVGHTAHDAGAQIVYDAANGHLFYDPDGTGAEHQVLFAKVHPHLDLTNHDFFVV